MVCLLGPAPTRPYWKLLPLCRTLMRLLPQISYPTCARALSKAYWRYSLSCSLPTGLRCCQRYRLCAAACLWFPPPCTLLRVTRRSQMSRSRSAAMFDFQTQSSGPIARLAHFWLEKRLVCVPRISRPLPTVMTWRSHSTRCYHSRRPFRPRRQRLF
eukprot:Rmarinus@m.6564